jgi:molybdopterin converting factor small subunit
MKVRVKLFAVAKELTGREELSIEVPAAAKVFDVRRAVESANPALRPVLAHALWAVDAAYANDEVAVNEHSDIALIPPVSGG